MRILVFGKTGQVGSGLSADLDAVGTVRCVGRDEADLADLSAVENIIQDECPDIIINAAAYTQVDQAETDATLAELINARAPGVMAEMAAIHNAWLIHYSTDYVFDGSKHSSYQEDDVPCPLNVYGETKLRGEQAIIAAHSRHVIFRTSWVYSNQGRNFLNTVLRLADERPELSIVDDQTGTPTYSLALSEYTAKVVKIIASDRDNADLAGVFNMTCQGETTWFGFAREILDCAGVSNVHVSPINTTEFPTPAKRPRYSVLDNSKLEQRYGLRMPHWQAALRQCIAQRESGG